MKPYMNLELYKYEKEEENKTRSSTIINTAFEYQSKIGRATGRMQSPKWVRDAIAKHYEQLESKKPKRVVWSDDTSELG